MAGLGALYKLFENILQKGHVPVDEARDIGRRFRSVPPELYAQRAPRSARSPEEAAKMYQLQLEKYDDFGGTSDYVARDPYSESEIYSQPYERSRMTEMDRKLGKLLSDLDIGKEMPVWAIDAMVSSPGTGFGKRAYGALFDTVPGHNISTGLTKVNEGRRNFNTADALLRNPGLSDLIIPTEAQIQGLGMSPLGYMRGADNDQKLGTMLLGGAERTLRNNPEMSLPAYAKDTRSFKKMQIMDDLLRGESIPDDRFKFLGYKRGGKVSRTPCGPLTRMRNAG